MASTKIRGDRLKFRFYTNREYFDELIVSIRSTKSDDRVLLMTMTFNPLEPTIAALCRELIRAAARGVHVTLAVDAHSFLLTRAHLPGPLWGRHNIPKRVTKLYRHKLDILEAINSYPTGSANILNLPSRRVNLPVSGRSHIKTAIINDHVYIGGCNLQESDWVDLMTGWRDKAISDRLYETFLNVIRSKHTGQGLSWVDRALNVSEDASIFIDSGLAGQSAIYNEALRLIDNAEKWLVITGQYFPNSITARHLVAAAKRGVKLEVVFSHPNQHGLIGGTGQHISILRERTRIPKEMFNHALARRDPMLHAKLIACDKGLMVGSHNYVTAGVLLGTAEIALRSSSEKLAEQAVQTLHRGLRKIKM